MQNVGMIIKWSFFTLLLIACFIIALRLTREQPIVAGPTDQEIQEAGYVKPGDKPELKPDKPGFLPDVKPVVVASGTVVAPPGEEWPDTLVIDTSIIQDSQGHPWIGTWVNNLPVKWTEVPQVSWPSFEREPSDWSAIFEAAFIEEEVEGDTKVELDWGGGLSWTPITIAGTGVGLAGTVDLSVVHETGPEWGAISGHAWRPLGPIRVGVNLGYRFGRGEGFHGGITMGVGLDL